MKKTFFSNHRFLCLSILFMWMKTYAVYKLGFDLQNNSVLEECLLLINPLSFIVPLFGIALLLTEKKQRIFLLSANVMLTGILIANTVFYGFYIDFITIPVLFQASNMGDMGSSVQELFHPLYIALFLDIAVLFYLGKRYKAGKGKTGARTVKAYAWASAGLMLCNLALSEAEQPKLFKHPFDREALVKGIGLFHFHLYDTISQTLNAGAKAFADEDSLAAVANYTQADYSRPSESKFGLAKGRNVIFVTLESTQRFVMDERVNGREITPFLNKLRKKVMTSLIFISRLNREKPQIQNSLLQIRCIRLQAAPFFLQKAATGSIRCTIC